MLKVKILFLKNTTLIYYYIVSSLINCLIFFSKEKVLLFFLKEINIKYLKQIFINFNNLFIKNSTEDKIIYK